MKTQFKGCTCFSFCAILISAAIFIFGVVEIVFVSFYELKKTETSGPWPFDQKPGYAIFAVAIGFLLPPLPLTVTAVVKKQRNYIFWACFPLLGAFTSLLVFGSVTIRTSQKDLSHELFNVMKQSRTDSKLANWLSLLQYEYKCCGALGYSDWSLFQETNSTGFFLPKESVPYTCCRRDNANIKSGCGDGVLGMSEESRQKIIYTRPCGPIVGKVFQGKVLQLGLEMMLAAFAAITSATFLYCGATELFCFGGTHRTFENNNAGPNVQVKKSGASVVSFRMEGYEDDNDNEISDPQTGEGEMPDRGSIPQNRVRLDSKGHVRPTSPQNGRGNRKGSRNSHGHVRIKENSGSRAMNAASGRSKSRTKGKPMEDSNGDFKGPHYKHQVKAIVKGRHVFKEQSSERKKPEGHSKAFSREGPCRTGSPVIKDVNANPTKDKTNLVETLFKGIDLNISDLSALSTTPNPSGTVNFPWTNKNGSRSSTFIGKGTPSIPSMKEPLQGMKALLPTLSHFSSLPMFQLVKFPTGETSVLSQYSPHFVHKTLPLPSSTLHTRQTYLTVPTPSFFKPLVPADVPPTDTKDLEIEVVQELPPLPIIQCEETMAIGRQDSTTKTEIELEAEDEDIISTENSIPSNTRCTTLGGTLATIVEESESIKSSPDCGTSPEMSGSNSPKGPEFGTIGGEWQRAVLGQSPLPSSINLKSQEDDDMTLGKEIPSLERKVTGEFQV